MFGQYIPPIRRGKKNFINNRDSATQRFCADLYAVGELNDFSNKIHHFLSTICENENKCGDVEDDGNGVMWVYEDGEEIELLTFDCFRNAPHYHYGPRSKNQRLYLDRTVVPNPLIWALHLLKGGKLAAMLERAGYKEHAQKLNPAVMVHGMTQVESISMEMEKGNSS